jgi:thioredoxin 1
MSTQADPGEPIHVDSVDEFDETIDEGGPVLVDYYADWCGPCKMLEPTVEEVAAETDATVLKVDIEAHQDLAGRAGVRSIPTLQFFADGEEAERLVGVHEKERLVDVVQSL